MELWKPAQVESEIKENKVGIRGYRFSKVEDGKNKVIKNKTRMHEFIQHNRE